MKRINIVACSALALALLGSCSKDQVTQENLGNAIRFKAFVDPAAKATETVNVEDLTDGLQIYAFRADGTEHFSDVFTSNSGATSTGVFVPESGKSYYWPSDGAENLDFIGYAPTTLTGFVTTPTTDVSITSASPTITNIKPAQHANEQVDFMATRTQTNANSSASGVALTLQHALSQIVVQAVNDNSNMKVEAIAVKIAGGVNGTATFSFPAGNSNGLLGSSRWTAHSTPNSYIAGGKELDAPQEISTTALTPTNLMFDEGGFMVIPQTVTSWSGGASEDGAYIAVLCKISQKTSTGWTQVFPNTANNYGYAAVPLPQNTTWEPGKKYTYTLNFFDGGDGGGGIEPPTDPTDPPVDPTIPVDPTPDPGDPVVGGVITLNVTVNAWQSQNAVDTPMGPQS